MSSFHIIVGKDIKSVKRRLSFQTSSSVSVQPHPGVVHVPHNCLRQLPSSSGAKNLLRHLIKLQILCGGKKIKGKKEKELSQNLQEKDWRKQL